MTIATADHAWALDAPGNVFPSLAALWRMLRNLVVHGIATKEQTELFHLIESAASRLGDPILAASDLDDLDDRIDALVGQPEVFQWNALITQVGIATLRGEAPMPSADLARAVAATLGEAQGRVLTAAGPLLDAYYAALRAVASAAPPEVVERAVATLAAEGPAMLRSPEVPPEIATAARGGIRAALTMLALSRAMMVVMERPASATIAPWLASALVERFIAGVRAHLRLLAAMPSADVPESIVPRDQRLDLVRIDERHRLARAEAGRTYEAEVARRRLVPDA